MKCQDCEREGRESRVYPDAYSVVTAMMPDHYYDENGRRHLHDDNSSMTGYRCSNGHEWTEVTYGKCWCGWSGGQSRRLARAGEGTQAGAIDPPP